MNYATVQPRVDRIHSVTIHGAHLLVAIDGEPADSDERGPIPATFWVDAVSLSGVWFRTNAFASDFLDTLEFQLKAQFAAELEQA